MVFNNKAQWARWMQAIYANYENLLALGSEPKVLTAVYANYKDLYGEDAVVEADFEQAVKSPEFGPALQRIFDGRPDEIFERVQIACVTLPKYLRSVDCPIDHICAAALGNGSGPGLALGDAAARQVAALKAELVQGAAAFQATSTALVTTSADLAIANDELATTKDKLGRIGAELKALKAKHQEVVTDRKMAEAEAENKLAQIEAELQRATADRKKAEAEAESQRATTDRKTAEAEAEAAELEKKLHVAEVSLCSTELRLHTATELAALLGDRCAELDGWANKLVATSTQTDQADAMYFVFREVKKYAAAAAAKDKNTLDSFDKDFFDFMCENGIPMNTGDDGGVRSGSPSSAEPAQSPAEPGRGQDEDHSEQGSQDDEAAGN